MTDVSLAATELQQSQPQGGGQGRESLPESDLGMDFVRRKMDAFLNSGRTQKDLARRIGISPPAVCQWLRGDYRGNHDVIHQKLLGWAKLDESMAEMKVRNAPVWVETPTAKQIFDAITFSRAGHTIGLIYGSAGVGKTTAIRRYADKYPYVWVWTATPAYSSMMNVLRAIRATMDCYTSGYQRSNLMQDILECVNARSGILIIDEAQHLKAEVLDQIRSIYDASDMGLVFSGNEKIIARMGGGGRAEFAQITSRVGRRVRIDAPKREDAIAILEAWGVTGQREAEYAIKLASLHGGLRLLGNVLREAGLIADGMGTPIDLNNMRLARESLGEFA